VTRRKIAKGTYSVYLIIYIGASILVLGIGAVIWLFLADKTAPPKIPPPKKTTNGSTLTTSQILKQLGLNEDPDHPIGTTPEEEGESSKHQTDHAHSARGFTLAPQNSTKTQGTASLRLEAEKTADESEKRLLAQNEQLKRDIAEMQSKNEKHEALLEEKNKEIEQVTKDLEIELKSRKEFNKIKDILEKELKDSKEKNRSLQIDLAQAQTEADSYLKRVKQLEEKIKKFDVEVQEKTDQMKGQQQEAKQHQKELETLDKKIKNLDPVIAEKDRKINSLVPLLKDLPEGPPKDQLPNPAPIAAPVNIASSSTQNQEGGGQAVPPTKSLNPSKIDDVDRIRLLASADNENPPDPKRTQETPIPSSPDTEKPLPDQNTTSGQTSAATESQSDISLSPPSSDTQQRPSKDFKESTDRTPKDLLKTIESGMSNGKTQDSETEKQPTPSIDSETNSPAKKGLLNLLNLSLEKKATDGHPHLGPDIIAQNPEKKSATEGQEEKPTPDKSSQQDKP